MIGTSHPTISQRRRAGRRLLGSRGAAVAVAGVAALALSIAIPATAGAADCPREADFGYNGACGPEFELPMWGDGGGWTDPSKYTTIQLADLTGNGNDELIARNDDGLEIWTFDATLGQWRPAIGEGGQPEVLTEFASPSPSESAPDSTFPPHAVWTLPQYYTTIQTVDLNGPGHGADIIARFADGIHVFHYEPADPETKSIDGGTWADITNIGPAAGAPRPFSDEDGYTDPSLYLSIRADSGNGTPAQPPEITAQSKTGPVTYFWAGDRWIPAGSQLREQEHIPYSSDSADYLNIDSASLTTPDGVLPAVTVHRATGVLAFYKQHQGAAWHWQLLGSQPNPGPFQNYTLCGADCFNSSPSYYETLQFANVDGKPGDEMLGRSPSGLLVYKLSSDGKTWSSLATLSDLKGAAKDFAGAPGHWASIRTGDILGNGRDQVLALDGSALQTWSYDPVSNKWTKLAPANPLKLGGSMWDTNASYYSTIRVGTVAGHTAVIARGPFGIRTWFYNLHGNSGWTSWLPLDTSAYPQYSGGQAAALNALTALAQQHGLISGPFWSAWTGVDAPREGALEALLSGVQGIVVCSGQFGSGPPQYQSCTPPNSSVSAEDWTTVVNETLDQIYSAAQVVRFFGKLDEIRRDTFLAEGAELPAIASSIKELAGAAGNKTSIDPTQIFATGLRIAGAYAGLGGLNPLGITALFASLLPSASESLTKKFDGTYSDLQGKFAAAVTEADKALRVQSLEARQSWGILMTIGLLTRPDFPWADIDTIGIKSSTEQGFALWAYQQLLPTLYARYTITNCNEANRCTLDTPGPETICGPPSERQAECVSPGQRHDFTTIGPAPRAGTGLGPNTPCDIYCEFKPLPRDISNKVWGPLTETCNYKPGDPLTAWTFNCNLGVNPQLSVSLQYGPANGWGGFSNYCGNPHIQVCRSLNGSATVGSDGQVTVRGRFTLPTGFRVGSAEIAPNRLLYQPGGFGDLVDAVSGHALGAVRLTATGRAGAFAARADDPVQARLQLGAAASGQQSFTLTLPRVDVRVPAVCQQLPPSDSLATPSFPLDTTLHLRDGSATQTDAFAMLWRCIRDRAGNVSELQLIPPRPLPQRPGLAVTIAGPRTVTAGATITYMVRVHNTRRRPRDQAVSSLWHLVARAFVSLPAGRRLANASTFTPVITRRFDELRRGKSRTLRVQVHVPTSAAGRICVSAVTTADSARPASAELCPGVRAAPTAGLA